MLGAPQWRRFVGAVFDQWTLQNFPGAPHLPPLSISSRVPGLDSLSDGEKVAGATAVHNFHPRESKQLAIQLGGWASDLYRLSSTRSCFH